MYAKAFIAPLITLLVIVGVFFGGLHIGQSIEQGKQAQANAELLLSAYNEYEKRIEKQRETSQKAIEGYQHELESSNRLYERSRADGLRIPAAACNSMPPNSGSPAVEQATAATIELPEPITASLRAITRDADEVTAQCRALLEWALSLEKDSEQ